jgi:guanyl-specific ribonuclease Sa
MTASRSRGRITAALVGLVVLVVVGWFVRTQVVDNETSPAGSPASVSTGVPGADSGLPVRSLSSLPAEAASTWRLVQRGGPFPYPRDDGAVFENREKVLPGKGSGYYHEYTVPTPGSPDRGARRLVAGGGHELYYTGDHYRSFVVVDASR